MAGAKSKKELSFTWLEEHQLAKKLACPHCNSDFNLDRIGLLCQMGHRFDLSRQGYLFMAKQGIKASKYDQRLFSSRRYIVRETTLYQPLTQYLIDLVKMVSPAFLLDAGSGEGSHLINLFQGIGEKKPTMLGIDLSKDGIKMATDYIEYIHFMIADLANLPLKRQEVDLILSILSPSNYREFKRVLKPDGLVVKILPSWHYLKEIRQALSRLGHLKEDYENHDTRLIFKEHFPEYVQESLWYQVSLNHEEKRRLVDMTPLTWTLSSLEKDELVSLLSYDITLGFDVLLSRPL